MKNKKLGIISITGELIKEGEDLDRLYNIQYEEMKVADKILHCTVVDTFRQEFDYIELIRYNMSKNVTPTYLV